MVASRIFFVLPDKIIPKTDIASPCSFLLLTDKFHALRCARSIGTVVSRSVKVTSEHNIIYIIIHVQDSGILNKVQHHQTVIQDETL